MKRFLLLFPIASMFFAAGFCHANVVINEVMYHPEGDDGDDLQWVELFNPGPEDVNIGGWVLTNHPLEGSIKSRELIFPMDTRISAGGYLLLVNDLDDSKDHDGNCFANYWTVPTGTQVLEYGRECPQLLFDQFGDDVHLSAEGQRDIDAMWYGDGGEMGSGGAAIVPSGSSLGRKPNGRDTDDPAADFAAFSHPTPGASNQSAPVAERSTWSKIKMLFR